MITRRTLALAAITLFTLACAVLLARGAAY